MHLDNATILLNFSLQLSYRVANPRNRMDPVYSENVAIIRNNTLPIPIIITFQTIRLQLNVYDQMPLVIPLAKHFQET